MRTEFNKVVNGHTAKDTPKRSYRNVLKGDTGDKRAKLRGGLEEAYVLGNID